MAQQNQSPNAPQPANENPSTGSFPGFLRGSRWFSTWSKTLLAQASIWDDVWSKLKDGSYEMKDWYKAVTQSVDMAATSLDELVQIAAGGPQAPPWASLSWPATEEVSVQPRLAVDGTPTPILKTPFQLCQLGAPGGSLEAYARLEGSAVVVSLATGRPDAASGEYIGLIFCDRYAEPLAVITLSIPAK
ncbi:MAG: hypothetical protein WDO74_13705 [Pseudomonadota bacterium]